SRSPCPAGGNCPRAGHAVGQETACVTHLKNVNIRSLRSALLFLSSGYGALQAQFVASFKSPVPLYSAYCGYGHSGRVRPFAPVPIICSGAMPFSTHFSNVPMESNVLTPVPPPQ